jgi:hypothetical protein
VGGSRVKEYGSYEGLDKELTKYHFRCVFSLLCIDTVDFSIAITRVGLSRGCMSRSHHLLRSIHRVREDRGGCLLVWAVSNEVTSPPTVETCLQVAHLAASCLLLLEGSLRLCGDDRWPVRHSRSLI